MISPCFLRTPLSPAPGVPTVAARRYFAEDKTGGVQQQKWWIWTINGWLVDGKYHFSKPSIRLGHIFVRNPSPIQCGMHPMPQTYDLGMVRPPIYSYFADDLLKLYHNVPPWYYEYPINILLYPLLLEIATLLHRKKTRKRPRLHPKRASSLASEQLRWDDLAGAQKIIDPWWPKVLPSGELT